MREGPVGVVIMGNATPARKPRADAFVRRALSDIDAAEQQLASLSAELRSSIERIAQRVEVAASQLESSPDKRHPTWLAANKRVDALMVRLARFHRTGSSTTRR